ncbi:putative ABC exporter domain-containing protein [Thermomonas sp.]|uniref:putative ABC exporter domain-containing protein n=1 Tax=Thermomonas sp. TaxID=1971895 RepID=UPI001DEB7139|nr:putative ABC exporter domain-containing protein [Thermomonas sp.]MBZ0087982.1 hypothetical protein [Thermomonas sp.]MCO5055955.1 hypothetical protein [Thermomonas sp.]HRO63020.1 putative ABC exporter domain-containing protein [Thermomonas sp.]
MSAPASNRFTAVAGAFVYLQVTSLANNLRRRLQRLRQPKYLLGALAGAAYLYAFVIRHMLQGAQSQSQVMQHVPAVLLSDLPIVVALVLLLFLWLEWLFAGDGVELGFSETEIAFLFPAPLTRTALIQYNLLRSQLLIFFSAFLLGLVFRRGGSLNGHPLQYATGLWLLLSMGRLHLMAASFTRERLLLAGLGLWPRRLLVLAAGLALAVASLWPIRDVLVPPSLSGWSDIARLHPWIRGIVGQTPLAWLLLPLQWAVAPIFATDAGSFLRALPASLGLLVLHYLWALRAQVSFEEGSIAHARKRALRHAARQQGQLRERPPGKPRSAPFTLHATGAPVMAFLWKGLLAMGPLYRLRNWLAACLITYAVIQWTALQAWGRPVLLAFGGGFLMIAGWGLLFGPMFMQRSVQRLLQTLDIQKAAPLGGRQIALGELVTPTVVMTAVLLWLLWIATLCFVLAGGSAAFPATRMIVAALGMALLMPPLCALMLCVPFAGNLYFPAWTTPNKGAGRGVEVMGQRMIFMAGYLLALVVALLPAALLAGLVYLLANWIVGLTPALLLAALCAAGVLVVELRLVLAVLGRRIDAFDLSQELR